MVLALILGILGAAGIVGAAMTLKAKMVGTAGAETATLTTQIEALSGEINELLKFAPTYASKKQLTTIEDLLVEESANLDKEKARLKEVEEKLESAQKNVESKEGAQQELKTAKEDDETKLNELLAAYDSVSTESIALERRLAASMKNLEAILAEVQMTAEQKAYMTELLNALGEASSRLRELLTEYQVINERLSMIKQQFSDLEEEYTKLVEQQLGE